jgi:Ca-activated chloride channel family protein
MLKKFTIIGLFACFLLAVNSFAQEKSSVKQTTGNIVSNPVSYGIVVDNSGSYRMLLERIVETVKDVVEENKTVDETFLVRFVDSEKIRLAHDFTNSKTQIRDAAEEMYIEGGLTAILDAVDFSAKYLAGNAAGADSNRRKILILITDGDDRQSKTKIEEVLKFLKSEKIRVYAIGLSDEKVSTKILDKLAKETNGKVYTPKNRDETKNVIKELAAAMRGQ